MTTTAQPQAPSALPDHAGSYDDLPDVDINVVLTVPLALPTPFVPAPTPAPTPAPIPAPTTTRASVGTQERARVPARARHRPTNRGRRRAGSQPSALRESVVVGVGAALLVFFAVAALLTVSQLLLS
ncbi:MAG: hypothetical protein WAN48_06040 [Actinomycetes bacterium]